MSSRCVNIILLLIVPLTESNHLQCIDSSIGSNKYDHIHMRLQPNVTICAQTCSKYPSPDLVGFVVYVNVGCTCYYNDGKFPHLPSADFGGDISTTYHGVGPINRGSGQGGLECYAFNQVRIVKEPI